MATNTEPVIDDQKMTPDVKKEIEKVVKANENDTQAMFYVYIYDPISESTKMESFMTLGSEKNIMGKKLSDIRQMLISENALAFRQQGSVFCNDTGAEVKESMSFDLYTQSVTSLTGDKENQATDKMIEEAASQKTLKAKYVPYKVYLKSRKLPTEMDDITKEFLKQKVELELKKPELISTTPEQLASSYNHSSFMASSSSGSVVHPADMTERHWHIVFQTNSLLNGNNVRLSGSKSEKKVERVMYPAFEVKPRLFHDYEIQYEGKGIPTPKQMLRIPRFRVEDDSYVEVTEKNKSTSKAIADSSLSEVAAELAIGGGAFGFSAGAKAGYKNEDSTSNASLQTDESKHMTITYNFPRVVLQLDKSSLELTEECEHDLNSVMDSSSLEIFNNKYGLFFATRVELGGRLHSSENSTALGDATTEVKAKAMKASAALSFSSPYVQASASASYGKSTQGSVDNKSSSLDVNMAWEAKGGDTLLCNNPPAWCSTVASFYNWRVVKQENLISVEDLISSIDGHQNVKAKFKGIRESSAKIPTDQKVQVTMQLEAAMTEKSVTIEENDKNQDKIYGKMVYICQSSDQTPYQLEWINGIVAEGLYHGCSPFYMATTSKGTDRQTFTVHGIGTSVDGKLKLKYGESYKVYSNYAQKWLKASSVCPGYKTSFLYTGEEEEVGAFQFQSSNSLKEANAIEDGDEVIVNMYDQKRKLVGPLCEIGDQLLGAKGFSGGLKFKFSYR